MLFFTAQAIATSVVSGVIVVEYNIFRHSFRQRRAAESERAAEEGAAESSGDQT